MAGAIKPSYLCNESGSAALSAWVAALVVILQASAMKETAVARTRCLCSSFMSLFFLHLKARAVGALTALLAVDLRLVHQLAIHVHAFDTLT